MSGLRCACALWSAGSGRVALDGLLSNPDLGERLDRLVIAVRSKERGRPPGRRFGPDRTPDLASIDPDLPVPGLLSTRVLRVKSEPVPYERGASRLVPQTKRNESGVGMQPFDTHRERVGAAAFAPAETQEARGLR